MVRRGELAFNSNGELVAVDSNGNEILLATNEQEIRTELGVPIYSDPTQAPQTEGRIIYVDGNGSASKGLHQHDGSSYSAVDGGGEWQETGNGEITPIDGETIGDMTTTANHQLLETDETQANNESFVRPTRGSDSSSQTAGNFLNVYDGESKDVRGEFNASAQFSPDKDGEYFVRYSPDMRGNTSAGDIISMRVQNVTDDTSPPGGSLRSDDAAAAGGGDASPEFVSVVQLNSAKNYELQVANADSSFIISEFSTAGIIKRSVVQ